MQSQFKVVITTSGIGSRLGDITQFLNKALVRIGKKPSISYILENIDVTVPIVVTLGYKEDLVLQYLQMAHPDRIFEFVRVDKYEGKGSSLAYSLLAAQSHLQCPFVFVACDTLFSFPIFYPVENWLGVAAAQGVSQYASVCVDNTGHIKKIQAKGALEYDFAYIGLAAIHDYASFWHHLSELYKEFPYDSSLNDTRAFVRMLNEGRRFRYKQVGNWLDIGNEHSLIHAREQISDYFNNLEKLDESIYLFDDQFVIKFFHNTSIVERRTKRASYLEGLIPQIQDVRSHFYRYQYVSGDLYSQIVNPANLRLFLDWCKRRLWIPIALDQKESEQFREHCKNFYCKKTEDRIKQFYQSTGLQDGVTIINQQQIPSLATLMQMVDWSELFAGVASGFHGDLHFENIIYNQESFCLLDWRQDFDGLMAYGDLYYDLAKLNHGMIISHDIVRKNLFSLVVTEENIECEILRTDNLVLCQQEFYRFLAENNLDLQKTELLTALIFLNIAPLHHTPYNLFLYFFGKLRLWQATQAFFCKI